MPRRTDLKRILVIGSGPIVIGQACEFDYSGTQAVKALRAEGLEVVLVNSNPATIMTDPEMADRTYVEPLTVDVRGARSSRASGPTRFCPRWAARPRSTWRWRCTRPACSPSTAWRSSARRSTPSRWPKTGSCSTTPCWSSGSTCRAAGVVKTMAEALDGGRRHGLPGHHPPVVHDGRRGRRHRLQRRGVQGDLRPRPRAEPGARSAHRGVGHRLEGIRARGDARRRRQLRGHLLD